MSSVTGTAAYASAIYTSLGQLAQINRGGNLTNSSAYGYDAATGAITEIKDISGTGSATAVQADRTYTRNNAGTITSAAVTGAAGAETQCYSYDQLQELTEAWTPNSNSCATAPSKTALGGPAPYWNSYTYDTTTGNRTTATQHGVGATDDTASTYSYPGGGSANPHGVTSVDNGGSGAADTYGYDAAGDTTAMPGEVLTYDADGRIATITKASKTQSDVYDADGTLLVQNDPDAGTTLFLGNTEVHRTADGTITATRTYTLDGTAVDERTTEGGSNKVFSLDTDIDGTADLEVGASDQTITRRWVDPFGNQRGTAPSWSSSHGFLNKSQSALTGLAQLGARAYDATLGRFLSIDPIFAPDNPQQDNGYSYSANNPITNSDPSGACYQAGSDSFDFHTNCSTGPGHRASHGDIRAPGTSGGTYRGAQAPGLTFHFPNPVQPYLAVGKQTTPSAAKTKTSHPNPVLSFVEQHWQVIALSAVTVGIAACIAVTVGICATVGVPTEAALLAADGTLAASTAASFTEGAALADEAATAADAEQAAARASELQRALDSRAQNFRTSAVATTREGTDVLAAGGRNLSPAQRALQKPGDILAREPGAHAEVTALNAVRDAGLEPSAIAASRPFCAACSSYLTGEGATIIDPQTARW